MADYAHTTQQVLRVAHPMVCNSATTPSATATVRATGAQQGGLKALAVQALARNSVCNRVRNDAPKMCCTPPISDATVVARVQRPIVRFRLIGDTGWATALGAPGDTAEVVIADLRARHGDVEIGGS